MRKGKKWRQAQSDHKLCVCVRVPACLPFGASNAYTGLPFAPGPPLREGFDVIIGLLVVSDLVLVVGLRVKYGHYIADRNIAGSF